MLPRRLLAAAANRLEQQCARERGWLEQAASAALSACAPQQQQQQQQRWQWPAAGALRQQHTTSAALAAAGAAPAPTSIAGEALETKQLNLCNAVNDALHVALDGNEQWVLLRVLWSSARVAAAALAWPTPVAPPQMKPAGRWCLARTSRLAACSAAPWACWSALAGGG
jgi:hypothetical protein